MAEAPRPKDQADPARGPCSSGWRSSGCAWPRSRSGSSSGPSNTYGDAVARTMGLITFSLLHLFFSLETSDEERTLFSSELLENPILIKTSAVSLLTIFLATTFGPLQRVLDTVELASSSGRSASSPGR